MNPRDNELSFAYRDAKGALFGLEFAEYLEGWDQAHALHKLVHKYDKAEIGRVSAYNWGILRHNGQRRAAGFAAHGESSRTMPFINCVAEVEAKPYEKAVLAKPRLIAQAKILQDALDLFRA